MVICQKDLGVIPEDRPSYQDHKSRGNNNNRPRYNVDGVGSGESSRSCLVVPTFGKKKKKRSGVVVSSSNASTADQSSTADHVFSSYGTDDRRGLLESANRLTTNALDWYTNDDTSVEAAATSGSRSVHNNPNSPQQFYSAPAPQFVPPSPQDKSSVSSPNQSGSSLLSFPTPTDRSHHARRKSSRKHSYAGEMEPEGIRGQEAEIPVVSPEPTVAIRHFFQNDTGSVSVTMDQSTTSSQDIQAMLRSDFKSPNKNNNSPAKAYESPGRQFLHASPAMLSATHAPKQLRERNRSFGGDNDSQSTTQLDIVKNNVAEIAQQEQAPPRKPQSPIEVPARSEPALQRPGPEPSTPPTASSMLPDSSNHSLNGSLASASVGTNTTGSLNKKAYRQSAPVDVDDSSFQDPAENVTGIHAMAMEHVMRGEYDMALQAFSQVLKVYLEKHGRAHPLTASAYHNLGTVHSKRAGLLLDHTLHQRHCREQALLCFQAAARSARDSPQLGPNHPNVAVSLVRIGFLLLQSRQYHNAVITFQEALRIRMEHYGATHGLVANLYNNLGVCHMHLQDFSIGRRYLQQALDIQKQLLAQDEFSTTALLELADTLCNIGGLCLEWIRQQGPDSRHALDAESAFLEALEVRTKVLGEDHALTNQVRSLHDMVRSIPLPKLSPRSKSSSSVSSASPARRSRSTPSPGGVSPQTSPGRPYATSSSSSFSPPRSQGAKSSSQPSSSQQSRSSNSSTPEDLQMPTLEGAVNKKPVQRLSPPSPVPSSSQMTSTVPTDRSELSSVFSGFTNKSTQMDRTVQSELGSSVFTSSDDVECYDASEESCLLVGDDQASTVVSYAQTTSSWAKSAHGKTPDRIDCLLQAKAILDAHKDYMDSPQVTLIQEAADLNKFTRQDAVNDDGLAPLGGTWPAATSTERITQDILKDPEQHLHTIHSFASNAMKRGRYGEALHMLEIVLDCQRKRNGMLHEDVGSALHNVGIAHLRMESHYEALQSFEEAVRVRKGALGRDHPQVAVSLVKVGISLLLLKRLEDSLWIFREALTVRKHGLGALHPSTARIYNNIGCVHVEFKELKEARRAFEAALDIQRNALVNEPENGPILFGAATTLQNLGYLYEKRGMLEKATMVLQEALTLQEKVLGESHPTVLATLDKLAEANAAANQGTNALKLYNELLERLYEEASFDKLQESTILFKMALVHKQNHDLESQIGKLQLAMKVLKASESKVASTDKEELEQTIQKEMLLARQRLEKNELAWV